ncbi:MAG: hypothetical protein GY719_41025 [bacterium]|nr:hypothetical protein [bacterium]
MASEEHCLQALDLNEDELGRLANVVGLGVVSADDADPAGEELAVAVYVTEKVPSEELREEDRIPNTLTLANEHGEREVPVRVIVQGEVFLETDDFG